ncbi:MAG: amino acid adenylation domain-containing protein [Leptolyngbyaceae cyanobacterium SM1_3_5]|nr:amino acid adenylation domain-containing protein [Leptolyngbyaceae cyanobacterium SM1_3_5]
MLKAGGAYVPLDLNYPLDRLSFMLTDAQATLLLTQQDLADQLSCDTKIFYLDSDWVAVDQASDQNLIAVTPQNLAYIVYTSGSTGKAKGVMVEHCSLVNAYFAWKDAYQLETLSSHLQMASFSFDVFTGDWVRALCSGAKLVLCPQECLLEPDLLYSLMQKQAIDTAEFGPAVLRNLVLYLRETKQTLDEMRLLIVGSDAFYVQEYDSLKQVCSTHTRLINSYGVSEATIDSTYFEMICVEEAGHPAGMMSIGRPFANTEIHLLDANLQPVPVGLAGEICISGAGLARGYLNRPEQMAKVFGDRPSGQRLYRTGDRARYLGDGNLEYLGRSDTQIKLRGFRIELGEIETILGQHPAVWQSVVVVREDAFKMQSLVAYLTVNVELELAIADLRYFLKQKLPDPMIPSAFVILEAFPLNANGKVDRRALPNPELFQREVESGFVAPRNFVEQRIASIWLNVLKLDCVGIYDNFFELGGHSLLATQVIAQLRQIFQIELPLRSLFERPTIAQLGEQIESNYHQILALPTIEAVDRTGELPLSYAQESLWFLNQLDGIGSTYNMPLPLRLTGNLNVVVLEQSLTALIQRHEILRTTFRTCNAKPVQIIASNWNLDLSVVNLQALASAEQEQQVRQFIAGEVETPFDLATGLLIRSKVLQLGNTDHVLLLTLHHIVADGWSIEVLVRELAKLYMACLLQQPLPTPLPIQYADFALWQRNYLQGDVLETLLAHWKRTLKDAPPVLTLPTDYPRPSLQTYHGKSTSFDLNPALAAKLKALSQQSQVTLFMTLLSAFYVLLHRYTQQDDLVVGTPIANRNRTEISELIGYFVNILVLRANLSGDPSFKQLLAQAYQMALDAYSYQDLPFEKLVEALQPERSLSHTPLFQVMFALHNTPTPELNLPDLTIRGLDVDIITSKFDLTIAFRETESGLTGFVEYNTDLFTAATIDRLMGHYQQLLEEIVVNPEKPISELSILTPVERRQFARWREQAAYPRHWCIHQLFEAQVEQTPNAVAVSFGDHHLTYQQLNAQANQLAHYLQTQGITPEDRVGICLERSIEMIVAVLAVLKAGATYVPLDSNYPSDRLAFMVADVEAALLLTKQKLLDRLPLTEASTLCLEQIGQFNQLSEANLEAIVAPENLAYIAYTSGSTGKAKGVMIEHHSLVNAYFAWKDAYRLETLSSHLQMASFSFDVFTGDWVRALCSGAKLVLCPEEYRLEPSLLYALMQTANIDSAEFSPVVLRQLMQYLQDTKQSIAFIKLLIVGSDCFYCEEYQTLRQLCSSDTRIINSYGVSEATIDSTYFESDDLDQSQVDRMMPIGRPFNNTQIYLLRDLQPVPIGVTGEIYIGGAGLARGYLNQPELTRDRFVIHPSNGERLYRTGDLARCLSDGTIELLGRSDDQIKLRGFRIEIGEIESLLIQHPQVEAAVVALQTEQSGQQYLVAYVVLAESEPLSISSLRALLKAELPSYMVPANYVVLEALPLTPNGKTDRRALPMPERFERDIESGFVAPRNSIEQRVTGIWLSVLRLDRIGIYDNFFELGGHSLLATQVIAQLRQAFNLELPLRSIFESPTIAAIAAQIESSYYQTLSAPAIESADHSGELPLSYAQESLWFLDQLEGIGATYNLPLPLRLTGTLDIAGLEYSLVTLKQRHSILRTTFPTREAHPVQVISSDSNLAIETFDLQESSEVDREIQLRQLVFEQAKKQFDLATGSLMRVALVRLSAEDHVLLISLHHIIADGWSIDIFAREFGRLYSAYVTQKSCSLPDLPIQYADFALWQRRYLQGEILEALLAYWQRTLAGAPSVLALPTDYPRPAVQTFRGQSASFQVDAPTAAALKSLSQQSRVTLFMTLLAAFQILLSRYSGQDDVVVGTPIANRNRAETSDLIGYFINILVLRTVLSGNPSFKEVLARVYQTALDAYTHQDLPFELLVKNLQPERSLSHTPLFQVMFVLQNAPTPELHLPSLTIQGFDLDIITSNLTSQWHCRKLIKA